MTNIRQSTLAKKVVLLLALIAALAYLRAPGQVQAEGCVQQCAANAMKCEQKCDGNQTCINECNDVLTECIEACLGR
jgi:hypothetical protein